MVNSLLAQIMKNELNCIMRAKENNCNQNNCINCDLVMPDNILINAYEAVIGLLEKMDDDLK